MLEISITMWPKYSRVDLQCLRETEPFPSLVKCSSATSALETCLVLFWSLATALSSLEKVRLAKISYLSFHLKAQIILINFTTKIKVDFNLDFKEQFWRILKTTLISRPLMNFILISKTVLTLFKTTLISRQLYLLTSSHSRVMAHFVSHKKQLWFQSNSWILSFGRRKKLGSLVNITK